MFAMLKPKSSPMLGIDISSACIKMLELSLSNGRYRVENYAVVPFPTGVVEEKKFKDFQAVCDIMQATCDQMNTSLLNSAVAVPDSSVITKVIQLEASMNEAEMETQIAIEADKYIPYPLEEVSLDFYVIGPVENKPELVIVLVVASRSENVEERVNLLESAGLEVKVVDVESYAVERACQFIAPHLPDHGHNKTIAVFDIGAFTTNLTVLYDMHTIFTREELFGGDRLTRDIQRHYGLSYAESGLVKKAGNLPDDYRSEVLLPFVESAVLQVRRALQFFYSASQHTEVSHILLAGGTASVLGLPEEIEAQLGIRTSMANPFIDMSIAPNVDTAAIQKDAPALLVCCGLALRGFES